MADHATCSLTIPDHERRERRSFSAYNNLKPVRYL